MKLSQALELIESQARNLASSDTVTRETAREAVRHIMYAWAEQFAAQRPDPGQLWATRAQLDRLCVAYAEAHAGEIVARRRAALVQQ
jgi:hypothetical protein